MVATELAAQLAGTCAGRQVAEVRLGPAYVAVRLETGEIGLGHMPYEPAGAPCPARPEAGTLAGRVLSHLSARESGTSGPEKRVGAKDPWRSAETPERVLSHLSARESAVIGVGEPEGAKDNLRSAETPERVVATELASWAASEDGSKAAIGLATLNAVALSMLGTVPTGDVRELLELTRHDHVAMVGLFAPLIRWAEDAGAKLTILEKRPSRSPDARPAEQAPTVLPQCSVALITSTTLINHTLGGLLPLCRRAREVVLLGPSTPLVPAFFAARGVTILAGVRPADPDRLLRIVSEGGGMQQFKTAVQKVAFRLGPAD